MQSGSVVVSNHNMQARCINEIGTIYIFRIGSNVGNVIKEVSQGGV